MSDQEPQFSEINFGSFRMSPQVDQLFGALASAQGKFGDVIKDKLAMIRSEKGNYSYPYADLGSVLNGVREHLSENGVCILQPPATDGNKVTVTTILGHKSGQWFAGELTLMATQHTPQGVGSAITYARRYALSAMVAIASEEDDDGKAASEQLPARSATRPASRPKPEPLPSEVNSPIADMLARMKDKYTALDEFKRMKREFTELVGDQGEMRYYDLLHAAGVEKSDQFKTMGESKRAAQAMQEALLKLYDQRPPDELRDLAESLPDKTRSTRAK